MKLFKQLNDAIDAQYQKGYRQAIEDAKKAYKKWKKLPYDGSIRPAEYIIRALLEDRPKT